MTGTTDVKTVVAEAAGEDQAFFRAALMSAGHAIISTDSSGRVVLMNAVAESLTGWSLADAKGQPLDDVFHRVDAETRAVVESPVAKSLREGAVVGLAGHAILVRRNGSSVPIDDSAAPIRSANGDPIGVVLVFRAVSEKRLEESRLLEAERQARANAEAAVRRREDLLAVVSHDLKNPLSSIVTATALLGGLTASGEAPQRAQKYVSTISRAAGTLNRLVGDLLDLASIESGSFAVASGPHEVAPILRECFEMLSPVAGTRSLRLEHGSDGRGIWVHCDRTRVSQILSNLLGNAIKFTPAGGSVRVDVEAIGGEARFSVADTGPGIPGDHLPHVFDRYWRARKERRTGIGLGLSIAKGLVEAQGGRIWVESQENKGATFFFTLRTTPASTVPMPQASSKEGERPRRRRLLVVDDDRELRESLCEFLEESGYDAIPAENGLEALEHLEKSDKPDLILLDLMMPEMDGRRFAEAQKKSSELATIPLVVMTSSRDAKDLPSGARAVIYKPLRLDRLLATIEGNCPARRL